MSAKKRGLGRGLDALLSSVQAPETTAEAGEELRELVLDRVAPGPHQPRRHFDEEALQALADSIRAQGVVQPIVVRPLGGERYEIVAGERRWRAAGRAGLKQIPAVVRALDDRSAMAVALVENIQRADLNPMEEAEALRRLIEECGLTHESCAQALGKSRSAVSNLLRLLELMPEVQQLVRENQLSWGHAKALAGAQGERQLALARQVVAQQLTVRQTEKLVQSQPAPERARVVPPALAQLEQDLSGRLGLGVRVQQNARGRGKLTLSFKSNGELQKLLALLR